MIHQKAELQKGKYTSSAGREQQVFNRYRLPLVYFRSYMGGPWSNWNAFDIKKYDAAV